MITSIRLFRRILLTLGIVLSFGCAPFNLTSPKTWFPADDGKPQPPASVTAIWSPALLQRADGTRARGFGGRLTFYGTKGQSSIAVDGALVVYAYDESQNTQNARPTRKYVFTREQFASHHSKSELGHSYSVWIPWDRVEDTAKQVSLIVRFSPVEGSPVVSESAKSTLPSSNASPIQQLPPSAPPTPQAVPLAPMQSASQQVPYPAPAQPASNQLPYPAPVQPASYQTTTPAPTTPVFAPPQTRSPLSTTTIPIPPLPSQR